MDSLSNDTLFAFCEQLQTTVDQRGWAVLTHEGSDVEHKVTRRHRRWLVTTRSGLGVLRQAEYKRLESVALDLAGAVIAVPQAAPRKAYG